MKTRLSVNINKIATLRNARGGNIPDVIKAAKNIERYGSEGITVHPRPDERHIRYRDVYDLKPILKTEFNIEGYPSDSFLKMVLEVQPEQVTLVPDPPHILTSNNGWDAKSNLGFLKETLLRLQDRGIRTSLFMNPDLEQISYAAQTGTQRIELYTEGYASLFSSDPEEAIAPYISAAEYAVSLGLEINAGHDLNLENLRYFKTNIPNLSEVSIGHALIADALYLGLENTVQLYLRCLQDNI